MKQKEDLLKLKNKIKELEEGWRRTQADFDNYQKRTEAQKLEMLEYAKADFMTKITPVLDNFRRAFVHLDESDPNISGIKLIEKQLEDILTKEGLKKIDSTGEFNESLHEAISFEESDLETNQIIAEAESGWMFGEKVIKPAKVRVSKGR